MPALNLGGVTKAFAGALAVDILVPGAHPRPLQKVLVPQSPAVVAKVQALPGK